MPALNFKEQFADAIQSKEKRQTIRKKRKYPIKVGDVVNFYTGQRTKKCRYLDCAVIKEIKTVRFVGGIYSIWVGDYVLKSKSLKDKFAKDDGFESWPAMLQFFRHLYGHDKVRKIEFDLIKW